MKGDISMKLKKLLAVGLITVLALGMIGCGQDKADTSNNSKEVKAENSWEATVEGDGSWDRVQKAGKITAGLDDSYPPMGFHDSKTDEIIGFDIDMAKLIGNKLGVEFEFVPTDWNSIVPSIKTKKFDVILSGMNMWDTRIKEINFVPYGYAEQQVLVKADAPDQDKMTDVSYFKDKVLGTQLGSTAAKYLQADGFADGKNLKLYKTFPEITIDLDNGRIQALAIDSFGASDLLKSGNYKAVATVKGNSKDNQNGAAADYIGIGVRKDDGDLQRKIAEAVDELLVSGELKELSMKWIGSDITEPLVADAQKRIDARK